MEYKKQTIILLVGNLIFLLWLAVSLSLDLREAEEKATRPTPEYRPLEYVTLEDGRRCVYLTEGYLNEVIKTLE